jgi:hypothetical protein
VASRTYVYAISSAENVSASEMMNNHIPNFFEFTAYGERPPDQTEVRVAAELPWDIDKLPPNEK